MLDIIIIIIIRYKVCFGAHLKMRDIDSKNSRVRRDHRDVLIQHLYFTGEEAEDQREQIIPRVKKPVSGKGRHHVSMACLAASVCL